MFVYTLTKKRAFRMALIILAVFVGIAIGIAAILTAINTDAAETKLPIYSVDRGDNKIAITFDCAWANSNTDELLEILKKNDVKATFFVTGEFCDNYPDDIRKIFDAGHEIENHSDKHPHIKGINVNSLIADTKECARKIEMITGKAPTLYRSPYGEYDNNTVTTIEGMGYKYIQWSVDSIDWQDPDAATITKRILDNTISGSILLFHNDLKNTEEALPVILKKLKQAGYSFAPVSDLIYTKDYYLDNAGKQIQEVKTNVSVVSSFSENPLLDKVMAIVKANLTFEEIASIKTGITTEIAAKLAPMLSAEQLAAMGEISENEYAFAWNSLMTAIEYGKDGPLETTAPDEAAQGVSGTSDEILQNLENDGTDGNMGITADQMVKGANTEATTETTPETTTVTTTEATTTEPKK